ncbi:MAG: hypothetical protein AVDCRST_MAG15-1121, partial [uncultured Rubellimicrobium sp.]
GRGRRSRPPPRTGGGRSWWRSRPLGAGRGCGGCRRACPGGAAGRRPRAARGGAGWAGGRRGGPVRRG